MRPDQTPPPPSITYQADNDAACAFCDDPIAKGDEVRCYEDIDGLLHVRCDSEQANDERMWATVAAFPSWPL